MRQSRANSGDRSNALWGRGSRGESRSNALWGRGGRRAGVACALVAAFAMASVASAGVKAPKGFGGGRYGNLKSYIAPSLLSSIEQNPMQTFDVIVQGDPKTKAANFFQKIMQNRSGSFTGASNGYVQSTNLRRTFQAIDGGEMSLTGWQILTIAKLGLAQSIVANEPVQSTGTISSLTSLLPMSNTQLWPWAVGAPVDWLNGTPNAPTIAVVDSGVQSRADFGSRLLGQINILPVSSTNSAGDGYGHGTFVSSIAAGAAPGYAGAAPKADILSLDVMNDQGAATVSDVIKAADWILANKSTYNIKVANFSLHSASKASVLFDPLDAAVEKLWLNGITVVAASGNYGTTAGPSGVQFAPGNDPFVITVGATDIGTSLGTGDDLPAP